MTITLAGNVNTAALVVPGVDVNIQTPGNIALNGVPTNLLGLVGTATWGPVNKPIIFGTVSECQTYLGQIMPRLHDIGTHVAVASQQGASNFVAIRSTDSTDTAATITIQTALTLTGFYTGTDGANINVQIGPGTKIGTYRVVTGKPGENSEIFDNLAYGLTGNAIWVAIASAINNGVSATRGASQNVVATALAGTAAPITASYQLAGGSDGVTNVTAANLVASMAYLAGQGVTVLDLVDSFDPTSWTTQNAFATGSTSAAGEGCYAVVSGPSGDTVTNAVSTLATAGIDSAWMKVMFGDWCYWSDIYNGGIVRLVSPAAFIAGRLANLSPEQSALNKPLNGIIGTQKTGVVGSSQSATWSSADLQTLANGRIDVITNPIPAGSSFGSRLGRNTSSNAGTNGDNYPRLTNFLATTLNAGMGLYVGQLINSSIFPQCKATIQSFLLNLVQSGILASTSAGALPFSVVCDLSNNPASLTSIGDLTANVSINYQAIVTQMIINLQGGQTVQPVQITTSAS